MRALCGKPTESPVQFTSLRCYLTLLQSVLFVEQTLLLNCPFGIEMRSEYE